MFPSVILSIQNYLLPFRIFKLYFDSENCLRVIIKMDSKHTEAHKRLTDT